MFLYRVCNERLYRLVAASVSDCLSVLPPSLVGQAWHRYFCQFKKNDQMGSSKKLRQMKLIPIGHHGLVSKLTSNGRREEGVIYYWIVRNYTVCGYEHAPQIPV